MIDLNNFHLINLSQFFDSVKFRSGSGYHLVIEFCMVMFYMLMILMKFSFVPQTFFRIFFFRMKIRIMTRIRISLWNSLEQVIHYILKTSIKFGVAPQSFCENQNSVQSWFFFGFQYQSYISYIEDTHQNLFRSANSFQNYCVHMKSPLTYRQTDILKFFLLSSSKTYKTWTFVKRRIFFFTYAITILSLFTYGK